MNKAVTGFAIGAIVVNLGALAVGAYEVYQTKKQLEGEIENVKQETNKTVQKIGKILSSFEV